MVVDENSWGQGEHPLKDWDEIPSEEIDWSSVIRPISMNLPEGYDLGSEHVKVREHENFKRLISEHNIERILDFGSGKVYTRDSEGFFTIITAK